MKTWKIYKHTNLINGKSYIGQTCAANPKVRWAGGSGYSRRNPVFYNAIKKYGWENFNHEILVDGITTLEEANRLEIELIAKYHTYIKDPKCWGYNTTPGGSGRPHSQSKETKQKISNSLKGRTFTEEHKEKISKTLKRKRIICVETNVVYESISEAARQTGIRRENLKSAVNNLRGSAGGYHWAEVADIGRIQELKNLNGKHKAAKRKVLCVESGVIYDSITAAAIAAGCTQSAISAALSGRIQVVKGYHWKCIDEK